MMIQRIWLLTFLILPKLLSLSLSTKDAEEIGSRIWTNECAGSVQGLTHWNKGENFASLGIGHFIWYSAKQKESFEETFPALLAFLQKAKASLPDWLHPDTPCPWNSREEFYADIDSAKMKSLRQFLLDTRSLQARFMAERLEKVLPLMLDRCSSKEKEKVSAHFYRLAKNAKGLYALLDYLNFKGSGTSSKESYHGQGWGLLQVLQCMPASMQDPVAEFVKAAKSTLQERVDNSPPERHEKQWLQGWFKRLDSYQINDRS
jgi:hypothetical protein